MALRSPLEYLLFRCTGWNVRGSAPKNNLSEEAAALFRAPQKTRARTQDDDPPQRLESPLIIVSASAAPEQAEPLNATLRYPATLEVKKTGNVAADGIAWVF